MKNGKLLIGAGVLASAVVLAGGWFLGASPLLASAAASDVELGNAQQLNELQAARLLQLQAIGTDLTSLTAQKVELEKVLPEAASMDDFLGRLSALEAATGAKVENLTSGVPVLVGTPVEADSSSTASSTSSGGRGSAATTTTSSDAVVVDVPGIEAIPLTLVVAGSDGSVREFLAQLQKEGRFAAMRNVVIGVDAADPNLSRLNVTASLFVLPPAA